MDYENELYELKGKKEKLEFALLEETFHQNSIPVRQGYTEEKLVLNFIPWLISLIVFVASIVILIAIKLFLKDMAPNLTSVCYFICPMAGTISYILMMILGPDLKLYFSMLFGKNSKSLNYGASNFKTEAAQAENKIAVIKREIEAVDKQIYELNDFIEHQTPSIDKLSLLKQESAADERFFRFAAGHWGDGSDVIDINIESGVYDREYVNLEKEIKENLNNINNLAYRSHVIDEEYQKACDKALSLGMFFFLVGVCSVFFDGVQPLHKIFITLLIAFIIFACIYIPSKIFPKIMLYNVEHKYSKYQTYAENNGIVPTHIHKEKCRKKISELKNRLSYLDRIFEYKKRHPEKFPDTIF